MPRLYPSSFLVLFSTNQVRVATAEDLRSACSCFMRPARQNLGLFTPQISSIYKITGCYIPIFCCNSFPEFQFQKHDVSDTVDELLSKNPSGLTEDGIELVKARVLDSAQGFFETTFTSNQCAISQLLSPMEKYMLHCMMDAKRNPLNFFPFRAEAFKCPELVAERHMPLTCQVRQWISRNIISVASSSILFAALLWGLWTIYWRQASSNRAERIYEQVCDILEDNAVSAKIGNSDCEPWVVASWLRDHLLVPRERRNASLWKKVEELILEDSRIDQYPKVIKGESKVVYEWQAGGSLSGKIKKVQGARVESRTGVGAIKLAQEMGACVGEVREQGSCDPARRDRTKA